MIYPSNVEKMILDEIENKAFKRKAIALTYAIALTVPYEVDWGKINRAIINRWSPSGLKYIKELAHKECKERSNE